MAPNIDSEDSENTAKNVIIVPNVNGSYNLKIFQSTLNLLAHIFIGIVVGTILLFVFRQELPLGATPLHMVLCVLGYQLLMAEAILSLNPNNGWSANLRLVDKKRAHLILQIMGSGLAIAGTFIKILDKEVHWTSVHGQFGLVALVFTTVSLVNGLASLYAYEWRKCIPGNLSKITHICFGTVAFSAACISLCYGLEKAYFTSWSTLPLAYTMMGFTACFAFIIIIDPVVNIFCKSLRVIKK